MSDLRFDILTETVESDGIYNLHSKRKQLKKDRQLSSIQGFVSELVRDGFLTQIRNSQRYSITLPGEKVVALGGFDQYKDAMSRSPDLELINETFKEIANIHSDTKSNKKLIKMVSIVTGAAIVLQSIFTALPYFSEPQEQQIEIKLKPQTEQIDSLSHRADQLDQDVDSLKSELRKLTMKKDSTYIEN